MSVRFDTKEEEKNSWVTREGADAESRRKENEAGLRGHLCNGRAQSSLLTKGLSVTLYQVLVRGRRLRYTRLLEDGCS